MEVKEINDDEKYVFEDSIVKIYALAAGRLGLEVFSYVVAPKKPEPLFNHIKAQELGVD